LTGEIHAKIQKKEDNSTGEQILSTMSQAA
jgi:hypothetical protein